MCSKSIPNSTTESIPYGYCHCGCGQKTELCIRTNKRQGRIAGEPLRFIAGHQTRNQPRPGVPRFDSANQCYRIPISETVDTLVSPEDFEAVNKHRWHLGRGNGYAYRIDRMRGGQRGVLLHRALMGKLPPGVEVDHINGNKLDNRRENLRIANSSQNSANHRTRGKGASGFIGVIKTDYSKWEARVGRRKVVVGFFYCPIEAAIARDIAALEVFGEFATLNFPELREVFA